MLISISGSQGSGKSTLIQNIPYKTIERKTSRSILADWDVSLDLVNSDPTLTIDFQDEILKRKLEDEAQAVQSDQIYVTERTFADLFVYALIALGHHNKYSDWINQYYVKCVDAQIASYQKVFYLTAGHFSPVADGVRGTNAHYSTLVDKTLQHYTAQMTQYDKLHIIHGSDMNYRTHAVMSETKQNIV
jgi:AAA domain